MVVLIFLLFISTSNLVQSDDNVAMESDVNYQVSYKVHPEPETAENYQIVNQIYGKEGFDGSKDYQQGRQNQIQINFQKYKYQNQIAGPNNLGYTQVPVNDQQQIPQPDLSHNTQVVQSAQNQYPQQQVYIQQQPQVQILGAEVAHLRQESDDTASGFSSYVEHVSAKDEEEIKSALKEGSVNDIKRLVPKSGVSFKIYHNNKHSTPQFTTHTTGSQSQLIIQNQGVQSEPTHSSGLQTLKVPQAVNLQTTHTFQQPIAAVGGSQHLQQQQHVANPHQVLHIVTPNLQELQNTVFDNQVEGSSHKASLVDIGGQPSGSHPNYRIKTNHDAYNKATSEIQFSQNVNAAGKNKPNGNFRKEVPKTHYNKYYNGQSGIARPELLATAGTNSVNQGHRAVQGVQTVQYQINPQVQREPVKTSQIAHFATASQLNVNAGKNQHFVSHATAGPTVSVENYKNTATVTHTTPSSYINSESSKGNSGYIPRTTASSHSQGAKEQNSYPTHTTAAPHANIEATKNQINIKNSVKDDIQATTTQFPQLLVKAQNPVLGVGTLQSHQNNFQTATHGFGDLISSGHLISQFPINTYIDAESTKFGQSSFDHQKALQGSTSFDIKNAIGGAEPLVHQPVAFVTPTPQTQAEVFGKQTLQYLMPKIPLLPTPVTLTGNHIHEATFGKDQIEGLVHGTVAPTHQFSYPAVSLPFMSEVNGKFFSQPQAISLWTDHLKQGNALTANDLHQSLIRLHLPKEIPQHLKTSNIEIPASFLSHQKQQPFGTFLQEQPLFKYSQDFQHKSPSMQNVRLALPKQPPQVSAEFFKTKMPNVNFHSILLKPEMMTMLQEPGKKIIPIMVKKRKNRSSKDSVIYGKSTGNRGPARPNQRQEKTIRHFQPSNVKIFNGDRKNEFSVSASYTVDNKDLKTS